MERGNRRHSSTFYESPKVKRRSGDGANRVDEADSKPLIQQILMRDDLRGTPDQVEQFLMTSFTKFSIDNVNTFVLCLTNCDTFSSSCVTLNDVLSV